MDELSLRRLRYRLQRQGMAELDVWLSPLQVALHEGDVSVCQAIEDLLALPVPELEALLHTKKRLPKVLESWLS